MKSAYVVLKIYDIQGREVANIINQLLPAGKYKAAFDAKDLTSGVYLYKIKMDDFYSAKKMILLK